MSKRYFLFLLFVATPIVEMMLLIRLGQVLGFWPTIALVVITGILGASLARRQGLATWNRFQSTLREGRLPTDAILDGIVILVSAALLLTPGVVTDVLGFLGLIPASRVVLRRQVSSRIRVVGQHAVWTPAEPDGRSTTADADSGWRGEPSHRPRHTKEAQVDAN